MSNKHAFVEKLKNQLDELDGELSQWEADAREIREELRIAYEERMALLRQQLNDAGEIFERTQGATDEAWVDIKSGVEDAWANLKAAFAKARSEFISK